MKAPELRVRVRRARSLNSDGQYVLYWMIAARRPRYNFALQHAATWARELGKPLLVFEPLRAGYRWASDRIHQFVLEGMVDNARIFEQRGVGYFPYVEPEPGQGAGLLEALARKACLVVTDDFPAFFLPRMVERTVQASSARFEIVDGNGVLPLRATERVFTSAHSFRRFLQRALPTHLLDFPHRDPLRGLAGPPRVPAAIRNRWPSASRVEDVPISHEVSVVPGLPGGATEAHKRWRAFLEHQLSRYGEDRNQPERPGASGLSPYLHFGHISPHALLADLMSMHAWGVDRLEEGGRGSRLGWWQLPEPVETFLDQLITWRELGFNMCAHVSDHDSYESLPTWALQTLDKHALDPRETEYTLEELDAARTHDGLWNAAQRQLRREGTIHNYLRMLWGKKILEWTPHPRVALDVMIELNNKYALDGRDPNSYSGIFWILGRYDRAWGPERPIFGKVRYMSSASTARKMRVRRYMERFAESPPVAQGETAGVALR